MIRNCLQESVQRCILLARELWFILKQWVYWDNTWILDSSPYWAECTIFQAIKYRLLCIASLISVSGHLRVVSVFKLCCSLLDFSLSPYLLVCKWGGV